MTPEEFIAKWEIADLKERSASHEHFLEAKLVQERPRIIINACGFDPLAIVSEHEHERSGLTLTVRHKPFLLNFSPQDRKRKSRRRQAERA
ncbi:hypothetical protein [Rhizobium leguminosarum]|jgi:hypothetical protein|uniref:hypothetical protein n=1 Tax=Rhizobium leguminosarum TaxID=384 RepID=UPI00102F668F|nr:hypothetical protein [Rhizobium leguminosarum]MBB4332061.1 hypothetical protein [Rhizobium leguminosarum]MBB4357686.1 hypothetical protein [Rhizobium leguminosarum]MBB4386231.1 hypothetical protein [Rhizobium leguminosarum]MBB4466643.1 hypothetical protein [Rhizobium leguminosarum]MBB4473152.1 hypothetical protein [Rhizobium leguminosarum]